MRFAIVGAGVIGNLHANLLDDLDGSSAAVVVDVEADRARTLADRHGTDATDRLDEALGRSDVDAVSVCVPSGLHADIAVAALDAGKHVIVEKPLDVDLAACDRVLAAERRSGLVVTTISQRRFQPAFAFLHEQVASGRLGQVTTGSAESPFWRAQSYYDSGGWRGTWRLDGGGALMNQGVHSVDLLLWLVGEPVEVVARAATLAHERVEVEDTLSATVTFASGALGTVTATTAGYPGRTVRIAVAGTDGSAAVADERLEYVHTRDREPAGGDTGPDNQLDLLGSEPGGAPPMVDPMAIHSAQYADFIDAVNDGRPPAVTTADGRRAVALVTSIYESARQGGRPVRLDRTG
jgi:predicted dehydrogenase